MNNTQTATQLPLDRTNDARCPRCNRMLAKRLPDGTLEIVHRGALLAIVRTGMIICPRCEINLPVIMDI